MACSEDCGVEEAGAVEDSSTDSGADVFDATMFDAADSTTPDAPDSTPPPSDAAVDAPTLVTLWAQWHMPNPDAAIAPGSSTLLPHPMAYDAGADGGSATALDLVTGLTWVRQAKTVAQCDATNPCGPGGHVPTRIQLMSLVDFTRVPTLDTTTFLGVTGATRLCTASPVVGDDGPTGMYWTFDFSTGETSNALVGGAVLCLEGP